MISSFCLALGLTQSTLAQWLGLSRFAISRLARKNDFGRKEHEKWITLFWQTLQKIYSEGIPPFAQNKEQAKTLAEIKCLELQKRLTLKMEERKKLDEIRPRLWLRLLWLGRILKETEIKKTTRLYRLLEDMERQSRKDWEALDLFGQAYAELEIKHLNEKILFFQSFENQAAENK